MLSRDEILSLRPPTEAVELDSGKVFVKGLTAQERDDYEQGLIEVGPDGRARTKRVQRNVRASLVVRCIVDESGNRLFGDKDVEKVGQIDGAVIQRIWDKARELSGMSEEAEEAAAEGFAIAQDDGSSTE